MNTPEERKRLEPELKSKWVAALRSGRFAQGTSYLSYNNHYCCLGVLKQIAPVQQRADGAQYLEPACGISLETQRDLAQMNDALIPFTGIADWIEANL